MESLVINGHKKPHVICLALPAQSHVKAMLKLAQLLHHKGLQITFVNTEYIHKRMLKSGCCLDGSSDFRFESIPDGIPRSSEDDDGSQLLVQYLETTFKAPFLDLVAKLPNPPTCIVSDGFMSIFCIDAAQKLGIPIMLYWTLSACGLQITFVNTDNIHKRMLKSGGPHCLDGSSDFRFETFPDSIPRNSEEDDASELILPYVETTFLAPFLDLAAKLPNPPTCIVSDGFVSCFTVDDAKKLGIPIMLYWTLSACGFMGIFHVHSLTEKGLAPPKG
ncbi:UDP-glucuronosyl/UDP-glucosyltransferase [Artemisia annua]|uniref:UDP-glucuronosyl/UDP-glucosyltransferase n=1 Tax=Artemisia annua TaxID=35608 RepID=A0A2U1K9C1_ARTAN|nr:UDP-glucuronosyl/UDP-glucosyltransferase [Artemisia annua]